MTSIELSQYYDAFVEIVDRMLDAENDQMDDLLAEARDNLRGWMTCEITDEIMQKEIGFACLTLDNPSLASEYAQRDFLSIAA